MVTLPFFFSSIQFGDTLRNGESKEFFNEDRVNTSSTILYSSAAWCQLHTIYDLRHEQDSINLWTRTDMLSYETNESCHPCHSYFSCQHLSLWANPVQTTQGTETGVGDRPRRRFFTFQSRKRNISRSASGPALTVVDADRTHVIQVE